MNINDKSEGAYYHGYSKNYQPIVEFYYNNTHQYMSLINILKHVDEHILGTLFTLYNTGTFQ